MRVQRSLQELSIPRLGHKDFALELLYHFPDSHEDAAKRAQEFQRLSPDERLRQLMDVIETGMILLRHSKDRQVSDRLFQQREADWQRIQRELFNRHGV